MRLTRLMHNITLRYSSMDESEAQQLFAEATGDYNKLLTEAQTKKSEIDAAKAKNAAGADVKGFVPVDVPLLSMPQRMILFAEKWPVRYGVAFSYILAVPQLNNYMAGGEEGGSEEDEAVAFAKAWQAFHVNKNK